MTCGHFIKFFLRTWNLVINIAYIKNSALLGKEWSLKLLRPYKEKEH